MDERRPHWSSRVKIVVSLALLVTGAYLLNRFSVVLKPLALAAILAYVLSPLAALLQARLRLPRILTIFLAYLALFVLLAAIPMLLIPPLARQFDALNVDLQRILLELEGLLGQKVVVAGQVIDIEALFEQITGSLQGLIEPVFGGTLGFAVEVISSAVWVIFIFVVSFYLIKDAASLRAWVEGLVPPVYRGDFTRLREEINGIWSAFFRGQLILATVVAILFTAIGLLLGLPFALAMGVLAGLLEFLPSIGHGIWLTLASLLAFFLGSTWMRIPHWAFMALIIGIHLVYQQFDLNYLIPRIIGRSVHLPPLVVILGIVAGAVMAGVLGILLAAPTIASARVIGRYIYANLFDMDPFPSAGTSPLPPPNPLWWRKPAAGQPTDLTHSR